MVGQEDTRMTRPSKLIRTRDIKVFFFSNSARFLWIFEKLFTEHTDLYRKYLNGFS